MDFIMMKGPGQVLKGRDLILFADDWGRHPSTPQHLARVLCEHNRILWINSFGFRAPQFTWGDVERIRRKLALMTVGRSADAPSPRLHQLHPFALPYYDMPLARSMKNQLLRHQVLRMTRRLGFERPIILAAHPLVADLLGTLGEASSYYLCLDDYPALPGAYRCAAALERAVLAKVDAVFSVSRQLQEARRPRTGESHFLPQGVDLDHFQGGTPDADDPLAGMPRPIIGFHGLLSEWIDVDLMVRCANAYPSMTFVVIGRCDVDPTALAACPNVRMLGPVPYRDLPGYIRGFDVGLIPFRVNQLTVASNPLKLIEYLALGVPVVSTDLPEVRRFQPHVTIGEDPDMFIAALAGAVGHTSEAARSARRQIAEQYSWRSVTEGMCAVIERVDAAKHGSTGPHNEAGR